MNRFQWGTRCVVALSLVTLFLGLAVEAEAQEEGAPGLGAMSLGANGLEPVDEWTLDPTALNETNGIRLRVHPNAAGHLLLVALLDNLGKGASGVAIQSLNLMLGLGEETGLPR